MPQDLIHDLLEFHIVPNMKPKTNVASRKPKLGSTVIGSNHIPLFASWIDKKDSSHYNKKRFLMILSYYIAQVEMDLILNLFIEIVTIKELLFG